MTGNGLLLDISRTVARADLPVRTGIDRVERAYVRWILECGGRFLANVGGVHYEMSSEPVRRLIAWLDGDAAAPEQDIRARLSLHRSKRVRRAQALVRNAGEPLRQSSGGVYLNVGHENLSVRMMERLRDQGVQTLVMVHDLIPLEHPGFAGDGSPERFRVAMDAAARADVIIANSQDTAGRIGRYLDGPKVVVAPLGIDAPTKSALSPGSDGFLCVGTIEPRKNHAMLLDIWSGLGADAPPLRIAGRRGWRNEDVFRRLDNDPMMGRTVFEIGTPDDATLMAEVARARAVLFPSLAEGFGLPLAEALSLGTPVIVSDLPALREIGGDVPEWVLPGDADEWRRTILAYAADPSPLRDAQMARMTAWRPPDWQSHFAIVQSAIESIEA